jgi:hypothetical protein
MRFKALQLALKRFVSGIYFILCGSIAALKIFLWCTHTYCWLPKAHYNNLVAAKLPGPGSIDLQEISQLAYQ